MKQIALKDVQPGDIITRLLAGTIPMQLKVQSVSDTIIDCGWTFDKKTGAEVDEDLDWGPPPKMTGSFISKVERIEDDGERKENKDSSISS